MGKRGTFFLIAGSSLVYFALVQLGLEFVREAEGVAVFWPAAGLYLSILILTPIRTWPWTVILFSAINFHANLSKNAQLTSLILALANTAEAFVGACIVRNSHAPDIRSIRNFFRFLIGCGIGATTGALFAATTLHFIHQAPFLGIFSTWWLADLAGMFVVGMFIVSWARSSSLTIPKLGGKVWLELAVNVALLLMLCDFILLTPHGEEMRPFVFLALPLFGWITLRGGFRGSSSALLLFGTVAFFGAAHSLGPFNGHVGLHFATEVQTFILLGGVTAGLMAAVMHDRRVELAEAARLKLSALEMERMASLGFLAGGLGHEINNPLQIIKGNLEQLGRMLGNTTPTAQERISAADRAVDRIRKVVSAMMIFGRERTQNICDPVDLRSVVEDTVLLIREKFRNLGIEINLDLKSARRVTGGPSNLLQCLTAFLGNSCDALVNKPGPRTITIATRDSDDGFVVLSVSDNGRGIAAEHMPHLFDPFFTTKSVGRGQGLGLATARGIIHAAGGTVTIRSKVDEGTVVEVRLPASGA